MGKINSYRSSTPSCSNALKSWGDMILPRHKIYTRAKTGWLMEQTWKGFLATENRGPRRRTEPGRLMPGGDVWQAIF